MRMFLSRVRDRREFLVRVVRSATLVSLAAGGVAAFVKRRSLVRQGKCLNAGICRGCAAFEGCGLPQALSARAVLERTTGGRE
ncbi:MAG: hypothetical protein JSU94_03475 [Phycisphaerales bacterium]|nr:MAG: hypothetical protein JSU94_03475 [Phycisphaerales bacterium]